MPDKNVGIEAALETTGSKALVFANGETEAGVGAQAARDGHKHYCPILQM